MLEQASGETLLSSPVDEFFMNTWKTFPTPSESEMASDSEGSTSRPNSVLGQKVEGSVSTSPSLFPELDDVDHDELEFLAAAGSPMISPDDLLDGSLLLSEKNVESYEPISDHISYSKSVDVESSSDDVSDSDNIDNALAVSGILLNKVNTQSSCDNNVSLKVAPSVMSCSSRKAKCVVQKPCTGSVVESIRAKAEGSVKVKAGQKEEAFKIGSSLYVPFKGRNDEPRPTKNAIQAKINREKKKAYITALEEEVTGLKSENSILQATNARMNERCDNLQREVDYLRRVLSEESSIAAVLQNIGDIKGFKVSSNASRKRKNCSDFPLARKQSKSSSGGVCLHVKDKHVSVEFCAMCAENAENNS